MNSVRITFLMEYRLVLLRENLLGDSGYLGIEMDRPEWREIVNEHKELYHGPGEPVFPVEPPVEKEGPMKGREFSTYHGIKCYFRK